MEVQEKYENQVLFVGVPGLDDVGAMSSFVSETGVGNFDHIPDTEGSLWERFGVVEHRTYVMVNNDGTSRIVDYGSLEQDVIELIAQ